MKRIQQRETNRQAIEKVYQLISCIGRRGVSYKAVAGALTSEGYRTSRGNRWTPKRLFRMLQREGISGLHGLMKIDEQELALKKLGYFKTP